MATTYETGTWETYGKWTLIALVLLLFISVLIATVWGWDQGYFDTIVPSRRSKSIRSAATKKSPESLNFSSYRSTANAMLRGAPTPPAYSPHSGTAAPTPKGTLPEPTYKTHTSLREQRAQNQCPLPVSASLNPYEGAPLDDAWSIALEDLAPPEPAATNPWGTIKTTDSTASTHRDRAMREITGTNVSNAANTGTNKQSPAQTPILIQQILRSVYSKTGTTTPHSLKNTQATRPTQSSAHSAAPSPQSTKYTLGSTVSSLSATE